MHITLPISVKSKLYAVVGIHIGAVSDTNVVVNNLSTTGFDATSNNTPAPNCSFIIISQ